MSEAFENDEGPVGPIREFFPYLCIDGAAEAIEFYTTVFGAPERLRMDADDGRVAHAELLFGSTVLMVSDEYPDAGIRSPTAWGGTPVRFHPHVNDVDGWAYRAVQAGARILRGPRDEARGERQCLLRDPWGHEWLLGDG
jgi:PhnB protein